MSAVYLLLSSPAAQLSEEAMDLVCSFVREVEDDKVMTRTLCALSLTSRRWTSSAVRALYFDPTRCMQSPESAWSFLSHLHKHPRCGMYARGLSALPSVDLLFHDNFDSLEDRQVEAWTLGILRSCAVITSLAIALESSVDWRQELPKLRHLQHLSITSRWGKEADYEELNALLPFTLSLGDLDLRSLAIESLNLDDEVVSNLPSNPPAVKAHSITLRTVYAEHALPWPPAFRPLSVSHLRMTSTCDIPSDFSPFLPASLETLEWAPFDTTRHAPTACDSYDAYASLVLWSFPFNPFPRMADLTRLKIELIRLDFSLLDELATKLPRLESLLLTDGAWHPHDWDDGACDTPNSRLAATLSALSRLQELDIGWVPLRSPAPLEPFARACKERSVSLSFTPYVHAPSPLPELVEDSPDDGVLSTPPHARYLLVRRQRSSGSISSSPSAASDEQDEQDRETSPSSASTPDSDDLTCPFDRPDEPSSSDDEAADPFYLWGFGPAFFAFSSDASSSAPPSSPAYVAEEPDAPRLEPGYEALEVEEEVEKDDDDALWTSWDEERHDFDDAERAWREGSVEIGVVVE
ncbi:hypothetical protein JCM10207_000967 [Rhodosporidiobolus poonsookiae]